MLEGVNNFDDLLNIEFGKGFGYKNQLNIGMKNIASRLFEYMVSLSKKNEWLERQVIKSLYGGIIQQISDCNAG